MEIGAKIRQIRKDKKLSIYEFSDKLNWTTSKVSRIENSTQSLTVDELQQICDVLEIIPDNFFKNNQYATYFDNNKENEQELNINFMRVAALYPKTEEERKNFAGSEVGKLINKQLPLLIEQKANINLKKYLIAGSIGKGQFAEIPWISIFRKSITETATKGIYIVYLFTADMKGLYLSLNQGFTYFKDKYGTKKGREEIKKVSHYLQQRCKTIPDDLNLKSIELKAEKPLGKGYMPGHIAGKYYELDKLPSSEELADDLRNLMSVYEEVIGLINERKIEDFYKYVLAIEDDLLLDEEEYNERVEKYLSNGGTISPTYNEAPKEKADLILDSSKKGIYPRDKAVAANALTLANFQCEVDITHPSFTRRTLNNNYTEAHHLVPLENHEEFSYSLDVEENVVSLCSNCHNCIHYGVNSEREILIQTLYEKRKDMLKKVGIDITFKQLKELYDIK